MQSEPYAVDRRWSGVAVGCRPLAPPLGSVPCISNGDRGDHVSVDATRRIGLSPRGPGIEAAPLSAVSVFAEDFSAVKRPEWLGGLLTDYQWAVRWGLVGAGAIVAFVFGLFGYHDWLTRLHEHDPNVPAPSPGDVTRPARRWCGRSRRRLV